MFGYLRAAKPELKCLEYDLYRGLYCGLCRQLGRDYGQASRFFLNYDCTLLAMLDLSLRGDTAEQYERRGCAANPVKKKWIHLACPSLEYAAAVDVALSAQKLEDVLCDDGIGKKAAALPALPVARRAAKKAFRRFPRLEEIVLSYAAAQRETEQKKPDSVDAAAHPTATALSEICRLLSADSSEQEILGRLGYHLGRYIYLIDAADDLEEDRQKESYNVFLRRFPDQSDEEIRDYARQTINASIAQAAAAYELLDRKSYRGILNNIVYLGLPAQLKLLAQPAKPKRKELPHELTL